MESTAVQESAAHGAPSARNAWIAIVLIPVGVVVGVGTAYAVAGIIGVVLDPATADQGRTFGQNALCYGTATIMALAAPVVAVVLAVRPARAGARWGRTALVVGALAVVGVAALMVPSLVSW